MSSTWGASLPQARQVYSSVVRPALVYGAAIWHTPAKDPRKAKAKGLAAKLQPIQNKCLRIVTGAYRATPTQSLETEAYVPPIDLYLDSRLAAFQNRLTNSGVSQTIEKACQTIQNRIKNRRGHKRAQEASIGEQRQEWVEKQKEWIQQSHSTQQRPVSEKQKVLAAWKSRWQAQETQRQSRQDYWDQIKRPPDPTILRLYKNLHKAESSILVQLWTGRTGLGHFLHKARVPGYESEQCSCETGPETPRHVLLDCPHEAERRVGLREALGGQLEFTGLLDTPKGAQLASRWMIRSGRISQFQLTEQLLYEEV